MVAPDASLIQISHRLSVSEDLAKNVRVKVFEKNSVAGQGEIIANFREILGVTYGKDGKRNVYDKKYETGDIFKKMAFRA